MNHLRSILLPAVVFGLILSAPLLESQAHACGGGASITPAVEVGWAVASAMGSDPAAAYEVESLTFLSADRALVDVLHTAGAAAGRRTRMIVRRGEAGWHVTASWALRPTLRSRTIGAR